MQEAHTFPPSFEEQQGEERGLKVEVSSISFTADPTSPFVVKVTYTRPCEAFRGLGHILGAARYPLLSPVKGGIDQWSLDEAMIMEKLPIAETANFLTMGTMIDCSRNGVLLVKSVKFLCRKLALMGYNMM